MDLSPLLPFVPHWCILMMAYIINCFSHSGGRMVRQRHTLQSFGSIMGASGCKRGCRAGQVGSAGARGVALTVFQRGLGSLAGVSVCTRHCCAHGSSPPSAAALMVAAFGALQTQLRAAPSSWHSSILTNRADKRKSKDIPYKEVPRASQVHCWLSAVAACRSTRGRSQTPVPPCPTPGGAAEGGNVLTQHSSVNTAVCKVTGREIPSYRCAIKGDRAHGYGSGGSRRALCTSFLMERFVGRGLFSVNLY